MQNKTITLPMEMWDRLIEVLDMHPVSPSDRRLLLQTLHNQLSYDSSDIAPLVTSQTSLTIERSAA